MSFSKSEAYGLTGYCFTSRRDLCACALFYVFVNSFIRTGVLALLALVSSKPFVFPSLGPTAYLLFFSPAVHELYGWMTNKSIMDPAIARSNHFPHLLMTYIITVY
jgi:hypothetical protein